ncbi:hypothetical protein Bca52824_042370 [Brassica carinata]|uniref:Peptidase A1 domain-containing protein n=1 Tax=Brassica carinata TaxID=52824 RepID=A0A8X7V0V1_BRACI|nr:hypothetical protein Bca52824_042370 [Brassica carinata]
MSTSHQHHHPHLITKLLFLFLNFYCLHANELELLLSFKSSIQDPSRQLSSWSYSSTNEVCLWNGVVCNNFSRVVSLDLSGKNISSQILTSTIFRLPFLQTINLSNNNFSGPIPHDIFNISSPSLRYLNLSNNNLSGSIPRGFLPNLYSLDLSNNMFSVNRGIPTELGMMKNLKWIYLGYNNLSGEIPYQLGELSSLKHLDLVYNNLSGPIPPSLGDLKELAYMFLYQNQLSGQIPPSIFSLKNLRSLDFSDNSLSGEIPELVSQLQSLEILHLFSNHLSGKIPEGLTSLPRLQVLQLWSNKFSGEIPASLGKHNNLTVLDLSTNNLTGKLPDTLCDSGNLTKLILFSNSLHDVIPPSLSECQSLERVRLQNNKFSGELPRGFNELQLVNFLDLSNNNLRGNLGTWDMPQLEMLNLGKNKFTGEFPDVSRSKRLKKLDLSSNGISGVVPVELTTCTELMDLDISDNEITGVIPSELSSCKNLVNLDMSHNNLTGDIPSSFSDFPVLSDLDFSCNQLSGKIPKNLGNIESLVQVNISHNLLHGSLPPTGAFLAINATAVAGNYNLCGANNVSGLPPCHVVRKTSTKSWWFVVMLTFVAFLAVLVSGFFISLVVQRKHNVLKGERVEQEDGTRWEIQFFDSRFTKSLTVNAILSSLNEQNVFVDKNGVKFVIKKVNKYDTLPDISEIVKLPEHRNIIKLVATCRSEEVAYLIHEDVEGANVHNINLGIDLGGSAPLLLTCAAAAKSRSYHPIKCGSSRCIQAKPDPVSCPTNTSKATCHKSFSTSFTEQPVKARLLRDTVSLLYTDNGFTYMGGGIDMTMTIACTDVALCLPSPNSGESSGSGSLFIGGGPYFMALYPEDISKIFSSTPLLPSDQSRGEYFIDVNYIQISGKIVPFFKKSTKICTLAPYTVLHSSIYKALVLAFAEKAKMTKVPAVKPFASCFSSKRLGRWMMGSRVPVIELLLRGGAKWKIYGSNSLVKVSEDVVCLGFMDGGVNLTMGMIIGGYQMEDNFVEFDVKASKFSFTSSLLLFNSSCSQSRHF